MNQDSRVSDAKFSESGDEDLMVHGVKRCRRSLASQTHIRKMSGLAPLHWQCGRDKRLSFKFPLHAIG